MREEARSQGADSGHENRVSRRRLLKLAAYSVPALQFLDVAAAGRALAQSHCQTDCYRAAPVHPGTPGAWYAYECINGQPFAPVCDAWTQGGCFYWTRNPIGGIVPTCAWLFSPCDANCSPLPQKDGCYKLEPCQSGPAGTTCWRPVSC